MHAIRLLAYGTADNLAFEELADPAPGPGRLLLRVRAAGVQLADNTLFRGEPLGPHQPPPLPHLPGSEVAGEVLAVGTGVDETWVGCRVVASLEGGGGYAELAVADAATAHPVPDGLDDAAAVAMLTTGASALGILRVAALTPDDTVLVMSAAGGMGTLFVQAALRTGATVIGAAGGAEKTRLVSGLGVDTVVDYTADGWAERLRGDAEVSVVLDGVGGTLGRQALHTLAPGGRHILHGWAGGAPTEITTGDLIERRLTATWALGPHMVPDGGWGVLEKEALAEAAAGRLTPLVTRFPLKDAAAAHQALGERRTHGKVVLEPS
ncbi:zinc-binding dehydrogenase [Streptomyces albus subsp. chlorinus]|uniref:zinc-binding dehydrogenase n=1 Tax=Streptomyces albus TaxID=1888 RepID=UPI0015702FCC|nr:zinc-binding dehydrogenase [Streptomyces albus]NSC22594.1 zinc-binding dehydrogenase [Streptomyces albus subsp. chlorinus]